MIMVNINIGLHYLYHNDDQWPYDTPLTLLWGMALLTLVQSD